MKKATKKKIERIVPGSIAEEMEIEPGDLLVSINDRPIGDILDYHFLTQNGKTDVLIEKPDGEQWLLEIEKDEDEDLGLIFAPGLMDRYRSCSNRCIFCFIDQLPTGMRETLYFKDDDTRLSFIQGNYVTLTNVSDDDLRRVIEYRLSPINISVHATDPLLRCRMLGNRRAGDILAKIEKLAAAGIEMNGQIVLCRGINDGPALQKTIEDLTRFAPQMRSVAVVPVGLTKYREGLPLIEPLNEVCAKDALSIIERAQERMLGIYGTRFVYASDELILLAGQGIPAEEEYEGYPQLENGVGMLRLLKEEVKFRLEEMPQTQKARTVTVATGTLAAPFIRELAAMAERRIAGLQINVVGIRNDFFGESITVSGLVTGQDIAKQLKGRALGDRVVIPVNMLRAGEDVFLDDMTTEDLERELGTEVFVAENDGSSFIGALADDERPPLFRWRQMYEQTDHSHSWEA